MPNKKDPKFPPNPAPKIGGQSIGKGYYYIPGETINSEKPKKSKSAIDNDKNWKRLPNMPKGRRY